MKIFSLTAALTILGNAAAWSHLVETLNSSVRDSERRAFLGFVPKALAGITGGILFSGVPVALADEEDNSLALDPPLASLSGDAKKVRFDSAFVCCSRLHFWHLLTIYFHILCSYSMTEESLNRRAIWLQHSGYILKLQRLSPVISMDGATLAIHKWLLAI